MTRPQSELAGWGPSAAGSDESPGASVKEQDKAPRQHRDYREWQPERCSPALPFSQRSQLPPEYGEDLGRQGPTAIP